MTVFSWLLMLAVGLSSINTVSAFAVGRFAPTSCHGRSSSALCLNDISRRYETEGDSSSSGTRNSNVSKIIILKGSLLIAGTTVGGGFLALPQNVVIPLGGFGPSALSLCVVWAYLLAQSLILSSCLIQCHQDNNNNSNNATKAQVVGIPFVAQQTLGSRGSFATTILLILLTEATLVSQLSRAGLFAADTFGASYRLGCAGAAFIGAIFSFGGGLQKREIDDHSNSLATNFNTILTTIFIASAGLLFQAGRTTAQWSRCFESSSCMLALGPIAKATPTMLQLLVYGEILPNVCHMLDYDSKAVQKSLLLGSFIPLMLLTGWAALGVALLPPIISALPIDPVNVMLEIGSHAVKRRLIVLAISAIGTTILGSYLALESAYKDVSKLVLHSHPAVKRFVQHPLVRACAISIPPLAVSIISPSLFLKSIDFAGSYPVLMLYGVIPPLMALRMQTKQKKTRSTSAFFVLSCALSGGLIVANALQDLGQYFRWLQL